MLNDALSAPIGNEVFAWEIGVDAKEFLMWGRREQLKASPTFAPPPTTQRLIAPSSSGWVPPHPAFNVRKTGGWRNCLLGLVALGWNERILDKIVESRGEPIDFVDRFEWRNSISAPLEFWQALEEMLLSGAGVSIGLRSAINKFVKDQLLPGLEPGKRREELQTLFQYARIDIDLTSGHQSETPIGPGAPPAKRIGEHAHLLEDINVRMAQLKQIPSELEIVNSWPNLSQKTSQKLYCELIDSLPDAGSEKGPLERPHLVLFPEVYLPHGRNYVNRLKKTIRKRNLGLLTGMYWHEVPCAVKPAVGLKRTNHFFVNEALLLIPISHSISERPYLMREFIIPKPLPAISEYALADAISARRRAEKNPEDWHIVPGMKWHRFIHPFWGNFSVAICSDILDPTPWAHFRKEIQHIFLVACNEDVELYQSLTWTRAYECYVNMVAVNHGLFGGSFSWTPRHSHHKELAILKGSNLRVVVDVSLSVRDLANEQVHGWNKQLEIRTQKWLKEPVGKTTTWKAPPHFFQGS